MAKSFDTLVRRTTTKRTRQLAAKRTRELLCELPISELRKLAGLSQREVAGMLGVKQPSVAKLEKQQDMQISTLQKIVKVLGGELEVVARFPKGSVKIAHLGKAGRRSPSAHVRDELQLF